MSQPLRLAYISIVTAVHDARLAASSSCGLGPSSVPPWSLGSSAVRRCEPISRSCLKSSPFRRAVALICLLLQGVEDESSRDLGEEVGGLRRHRLARLGHLAHLLDRRAAHEEGGVVAAGLDRLARVGEALRVTEPV